MHEMQFILTDVHSIRPSVCLSVTSAPNDPGLASLCGVISGGMCSVRRVACAVIRCSLRQMPLACCCTVCRPVYNGVGSAWRHLWLSTRPTVTSVLQFPCLQSYRATVIVSGKMMFYILHFLVPWTQNITLRLDPVTLSSLQRIAPLLNVTFFTRMVFKDVY